MLSKWTGRAIFCLALGLNGPARADHTACSPHSEMLSALYAQYHERPIAFQVIPPHDREGPQLLEILLSEDGSTGSILQTDPASGRSCLLLALRGAGIPA